MYDYMNLKKILLVASALMVTQVAAASSDVASTKPVAEQAAPVAHTLATRDGNLYYETEGSGTPLVLVPGGPGASRVNFQPWFSRLAGKHTIVYFDAIGRGRSARLPDPAGYTVERELNDIEAVRVALGAERIDLLGQSYGGIPALLYALKYPQRVGHLILSSSMIDAASFQANIDVTNHNLQTIFPDSWAKVQQLRAQGVLSSDERSSVEYARMKYMMYWFDPKNAARLKRPEAADQFSQEVYAAMLGNDPDYVVGGTLRGYDPLPLLPQLRAPTLVVGGRYDRVATPAIVQRSYDLIGPARAKLVMYEYSGHRPWVEESDAYFKMLEDFLDHAAH